MAVITAIIVGVRRRGGAGAGRQAVLVARRDRRARVPGRGCRSRPDASAVEGHASSDPELRRPRRRVRPLHGPVLVAARAALRGVRRRRGRASRVLDVGCGPGALTAELVGRLGPAAVTAVDPSEPFVAAARAAQPRRRRPPGVGRGAAVRRRRLRPQRSPSSSSTSWRIPSPGLREMRAGDPGGRRSSPRASGITAAGRGPLSPFWDAVHALDPGVRGRVRPRGLARGHLTRLFAAAGLREVEEVPLAVRSSMRRSTSGGSRSRSASAPPAATSRGSPTRPRTVLRERCRAAARRRAVRRSTARAWSARAHR